MTRPGSRSGVVGVVGVVGAWLGAMVVVAFVAWVIAMAGVALLALVVPLEGETRTGLVGVSTLVGIGYFTLVAPRLKDRQLRQIADRERIASLERELRELRRRSEKPSE